MPKFDKKLPVYEDILKSATKLFYEKGYKNTLISDIAQDLNIAKGLILYYYDTKSNLASKVNANYIIEIDKTLSLPSYKQYYDEIKYSPILHHMLVSITTMELYRHDEKAKSFYVDCLMDSSQSNIEASNINLFKTQIKRQSEWDEISDEEIKMALYAQRGTSIALELAYFRGILNVEYDTFLKYMLASKYRLMMVPEDTIKNLIDLSFNIYHKLNITFEPYFKIAINN